MTDTAAGRLAASLRTVMRDQDLSGAELAERIAQLTGKFPSPVWVSRRTGGSRLKPLLDVDPDLFVIARALEINRSDLIEIVIRAVFGDPEDEPIPYELTERGLLPSADGRAQCAAAGCDQYGIGGHDPVEHVEVPPTPAEDEFASLPVLDPSVLTLPPDHAFVSAADQGHPYRCAYAKSHDDATGPCFRHRSDHTDRGPEPEVNTFADHLRHTDRGEVSPDCPYCTVAED